MRKGLLIGFLMVFLPLCLNAQEQEGVSPKQETQEKKNSRIFTGFTGGMMLHGGYLFSDSPEKVFSNTGLGSRDYIKALPNDGFCYGLGGSLRVHLIDHIHLGAEGFVSTMPLMKTGSNVRTGWGGAFVDFYANWGKVHPLVGLTVGGGSMKKLYVPDAAQVEQTTTSETTIYNSSYVKTPFFLLDPYVGIEIGLTTHMALIIRIDYLLPFNIHNKGLSEIGKTVNWEHFVSPSGPRLYVGLMFGNLKRKQH